VTVERRELSIGGRTIPLEIHRVPRARRIILTSLPTKGVFRLSLPRRVSLAKGLEFVDERHDWIADVLTAGRPSSPSATAAACRSTARSC